MFRGIISRVLALVGLIAILGGGWFLLTADGESAMARQLWLTNTPIAHRGLHSGDGTAPENSMRAFERAIEEHVAIELDVQLLSDGQVVVFHDENLKRMTGVDKPISEVASGDLYKYQLLDSDQAIPLFSDVLARIDGQVPILVEIKSLGEAGALEPAVYDLLKDYRGSVAVQSFSPLTLEWFAENAPELPRGQLASSTYADLPWYQGLLLQNMLLNFKSRPNFIAYNVDDLPYWIVSWKHTRGLPVLGWTVNTANRAAQAAQHCDNIIFESADGWEGYHDWKSAQE